jgi:hypothetical protein
MEGIGAIIWFEKKWRNGGFVKYSIGKLHSPQIATFLNNAGLIKNIFFY